MALMKPLRNLGVQNLGQADEALFFDLTLLRECLLLPLLLLLSFLLDFFSEERRRR